MPIVLRLTQHTIGEQRYRIECALEGDGTRRTANVEFEFALTEQEQKDIRWYLEDYAEHPHDPEPNIAAKIETRLREIGKQLFAHIFETNRDATKLWDKISDSFEHVRVEIITEAQDAAALPWELLWDGHADRPLAVRADTFVRSYAQAAKTPSLPQEAAPPIRILLVICRPGGRADVPFRSVAMKLLKGLNADARKLFRLDVLRPPTFEQLSKTLRRAQQDGEPYHVVAATLRCHRLFALCNAVAASLRGSRHHAGADRRDVRLYFHARKFCACVGMQPLATVDYGAAGGTGAA